MPEHVIHMRLTPPRVRPLLNLPALKSGRVGAAILLLLLSLGMIWGVTHHNPKHVHVTGGSGATLPYVELEAENATTNGTILGPDRTFTHIAAEASGREAVQLVQGQYVEFTLPKSANSIVVRFSIPDSSDGAGLTAPLNLYVNGARQPDLSLTSKYSWVYGAYPFNNTPSNGTPHHFFDETRALLPEMAAGSKVRLQVDANDTAPSYIIDLADFEEVPAPAAEPTGYLSITDYGADPTGAQDSTTAITNAIAAAQSQGKGVWIPKGTFTVPGHLTVNNVTIRGSGPWYSVLHGDGVGVYGNGAPNPSQNVKLYDFAIFAEVTVRNDSAILSGIGGSMGGGSVIQNIWIEHNKTGMWFDGPSSGLTITGCRIRDMMADGLNLHDGVSNTIVQQTMVRNTGDDGLAMWSDQNADHDNAFQFDTVQLPNLANAIGVYGGSNNSVTDNLLSDTLWEGGGIEVGNRFGSVPLAGTTTLARNTLLRTGSYDVNLGYGDGALWFYAADSNMTGAINVTNEEIDNSSYEAIQFLGSSVSNITFDQVSVNGAGNYALQEQAPGSAMFSNTVAVNLGLGGQYNCGTSFTISQGSGNSGWSDTHCGSLTATATPAATATTTQSPTATPPLGQAVALINAGGAAAGSYVADTDFDTGNTFSDTSTSINTTAGFDSDPAPQAVYQTCRWASAFTYTIPNLTSGASYTVILHWAELTWQSAGARKFNVAINGNQVLSGFDVYATAGYKTALNRSFTATANSSGQIVIAFSQGGADNPFVSGVEVWSPQSAPAPTPAPANTPTPTPTPAPQSSLQLVTALDAGSSTAVGNYAADADFDTGSTFADTSTGITVGSLDTNPAPQAVYQTCRWAPSFTYTIPNLTPGGAYTVRLHWAELTWQSAGARKFNVAINGSQVLSGFDVYATAGYKTALSRSFTTTANSAGQIAVAFSQGGADNPFVSGIEVLAPQQLVTAINSGSTAGAGAYIADTGYSAGGNVYSDTSTPINTTAGFDSDPAPQAVYQTCRWAPSFTYTISGLTAGTTYTVQLHWAELSWQSAGARKFNVAINGSQVLSGFDVYATAGYKTALNRSFTATANSSGQIVIAFSQGGADNPFVSGIEVYH